MDSLFNDICVLVTAAFVLTFVPGLRLQERALLSMRDRGTALLVFLVLGLGRRSERFAQRLAQRADRGGMRGWFGGGPVGRAGRQRVCDLAGGEA